MVVKAMNRFKKKEAAADPAPAKETLLLTEIRDILAKDKSKL
jgi:large conductance mechanosensitive channel